jgi:hypothetical protein
LKGVNFKLRRHLKSALHILGLGTLFSEAFHILVFLLYIFRDGAIVLYEPNTAVLTAEIALSANALVYVLYTCREKLKSMSG